MNEPKKYTLLKKLFVLNIFLIVIFELFFFSSLSIIEYKLWHFVVALFETTLFLLIFLFFIIKHKNVRWFFNYYIAFSSLPLFFLIVTSIESGQYWILFSGLVYLPAYWIFVLYNSKEVIAWLAFNKKGNVNYNLLLTIFVCLISIINYSVSLKIFN